ncbi:TlpA family protein disulfide reductase [Horticoccus luteus]|uniref:TlpA family protein disulfide reductase n=1 Tax=Horticoccus luteus TaxID=2862869 RepID=A0A8F9XLU8_9BACT|nr:TlpA disulfide reductase family protein [Horticoccus luteus]QYM79389.1 TlpA family protein disulfide reductase [Horticoccus luteus]
MKPFSTILLAGFLVGGLTACGAKKDQPAKPHAEEAVTAGAKKAAADPSAPLAPAWTLKDVDGHEVTSAQFKGKVVVVDFWATWCGPCRKEIPGYIALQKKYGDKGLAIIGVSLDQAGPGVVKKFVADNKVNYTIVMGSDEVVAAFGGVEGIPTTFLIDRDGRIRDRKVGTEETASYEKKIAAVL